MNGHDTDRRDETAMAPAAPGSQDALPHAGASYEAGPAHFRRLTKRSEFLAVAKGVRVHDVAFTMQATRAQANPPAPPADRRAPGGDAQEASPVPRFGLTVTKKTGNSVVRNRIRRRLREALRLSPASRALLPEGVTQDVVLVARREALTRPFSELTRDIERSMKRLDGRFAKGDAAPSSAARTRGRSHSTHTQVSRAASRTDQRPGPTS